MADRATSAAPAVARTDQAEGLRRLLGRNTARVIALESAAAGVGKTSIAINVAAALATRGLQVLLLDGSVAAGNISTLLGLRSRFDLHDALDGTCAIDDVLLHGPAGVMVLPAGGALRYGHSARERERFDAKVMQLAPRFDYVLVDAGAESAALRELSSESIIVLPATPTAVTGAYALIKQLSAQRAQQRLHVLLNRVSNERNARQIFDNLRRVAAAHLQATLESLGHVPTDAQLQRAAEGRQPVTEHSPASPAAAGFHRIAAAIAAWSQPAPARAPAARAATRSFEFPTYATAHAGA